MILGSSQCDVNSRVREFHADERGESSVLANVMKLAVAALVVVVLAYFGQSIVCGLFKFGEQIGLRDAQQQPPQWCQEPIAQ